MKIPFDPIDGYIFKSLGALETSMRRQAKFNKWSLIATTALTLAVWFERKDNKELKKKVRFLETKISEIELKDDI